MDVSFLLIADYANQTREGKLNIMGIFNVLGSSEFPFRHPQMYVIVQFRADPAEQGRNIKVELILMDEDGTKAFSMGGPMAVPKAKGMEQKEFGNVFSLSGLEFKKAGEYSLKLLVNGELKKDTGLKITDTTKQ